MWGIFLHGGDGWFGSLHLPDLSREAAWPSAGFASRLADYNQLVD